MEDIIHFKILYKETIRNIVANYHKKHLAKRKRFCEHFEIVLNFHLRLKNQPH